MRNLVVDEKFNNKKLSSFLQANFNGLSLNTYYKALRKKDILINGIRIKENVFVHTGDNITIYITDDYLFNSVNIDIVYEDDNILVINKPSGIEVVSNKPEADTLTSVLQKQLGINVIPCHRLDSNTSGIVLFAKNNPFLFSLTAGLYCATIVVSRVFSIIQKPTVRSIVINVLIVALAVALAIGILSTDPNQTDVLKNVILIECLFIAIVSFVEAMTIALAQLKVRVLFKIITNTFSLEVLFGLLVIIVCFSIILSKVEPAASTEATIQSFPDALWYCFAVVTTIGFGDMVAITPIGKILTVILGIYGLVVVAVITSIIVNFYNATVGKQDQKELEEIKDEEKKK